MNIVDMILRRLLSRLIGRGMNAGLTRAARGGKPAAQMTPAERRQAREARDMARRARQAARLTRRLR